MSRLDHTSNDYPNQHPGRNHGRAIWRNGLQFKLMERYAMEWIAVSQAHRKAHNGATPGLSPGVPLMETD